MDRLYFRCLKNHVTVGMKPGEVDGCHSHVMAIMLMGKNDKCYYSLLLIRLPSDNVLWCYYRITRKKAHPGDKDFLLLKLP